MDQEQDCGSSRNLETVIAVGGSDLEGGNEACSSCSMIELNEKVCRVCHLSAKDIGKSAVELIELGCGCKDCVKYVARLQEI
ncbi:uncharacterized protein LOC130985338 isoform X2 [Salvia miltiorrhiza]|uniref:uncharacterized protein LOC130985338 isoform X2 n=1 Tax=Salvia miltiorrhiza TaxID=226208 RepID=UPI0025ABC387|nr:uncharacterized protein LOC130985338 isoform X2 [Salvia miltiorrhiza]